MDFHDSPETTFSGKCGSGVMELADPVDRFLPHRTVAISRTSEGKDIVLQEDNGSHFLYLGGEMLMGGRYHGSEDALGSMGCAGLAGCASPKVLIGGLGMGFTLRAALDALGPDAQVITAELSEAVIRWNSPGGPLAEAAGTPAEDPRSQILCTDLGDFIRASAPASFDAVLIDTDNEPRALSFSGNSSLYTLPGLQSIRRTLRPGGVLGFWFLDAPAAFDDLIRQAGFDPVRHAVPCGEGGLHLIILATLRNTKS
jgi:spermidine synthase